MKDGLRFSCCHSDPLVVLTENSVSNAVPGLLGVEDFDVKAGEELRR